MEKKYFYIRSFSITLLYWCLDAYTHVALYGSSFESEFFLKGPHNDPSVKITIAFIIFFATFLPYFRTESGLKSKKDTPCIQELDTLKQLSEILYSPLPPKITIAKSLETLTTLLGFEASILFIYSKDTLSIYNESAFVKSHFKAKELFPFRPYAVLSPVEKIAHTCFLEKRPFSQENVLVENQKLILTSFILKETKSEQILGNLMLASKGENVTGNAIPLIEKFIEHLSFALAVALKKEAFAIHNAPSTDSAGIDKDLSVFDYLKLMERIEREFKRNRRYHTELTLMLIDIPMLKNLSNVFPPEIILSLKKDFTNIIKKNVREVDTFGKWTNEQFALLLPDADFRAAQGTAKKIQAILENQKFVQIGKIACCFGITSLSSKDTLSSFRLRAENALTLASSKEGNQIEVKLLV